MPRLLRTYIVALAVVVGGAASAQMISPAFNMGLLTPAPGVTAQSIVMASTAMQYLTTTWSHAPTDPTKATLSFWVKFVGAGPSGNKYLFSTWPSSGHDFVFKYAFGSLQTSDDYGGNFNVSNGNTTDTSWHHYLVEIDTNQSPQPIGSRFITTEFH
jgi:hypothetical protein